jgi:hypothetical protein
MLVGKITPGEAQLCADQGLTRRLNRIFEYQGLSYVERPKIAAVLQSSAGGSPAAKAGEEPAVGPSTKRKHPERSPKVSRTKKVVALRKRPREATPRGFSHRNVSRGLCCFA